jgi:hypothetical protein
MKKIVTILLIGISIPFLSAQNSLNNQNSNPYSFKLLEQNSNYSQPRALAFQTDVSQSVDRPDLYRFFNDNDENTINIFSENKTNDEQFLAKKRRGKYKGNYFMVGAGYGNSYGGMGFKGQFRMGKTMGFGAHIGVGFFPYAPVLASAGVKFFPYKDLYINAQFGFTGVETTTTWYTVERHVVYGTSLLVGGDWTWGKKIGFGFNAALGATYNFNSILLPFGIAVDSGFIIRF